MKFKNNILAFIIIGIAGAVNHFIYSLSGNNSVAGIFFPINESTWEHLKLLFFPAIVYFAIEYLLLRKKPQNYIQAAITGIFCGMFSIIVIFYTLNGVIGRNSEFINIIIFYIAVIITIVKRNRIIESGKIYSKEKTVFLYIITVVTAVLFAVWSFRAPNLGIFISPVG